MLRNKTILVDFDNTLTHKSVYPITGKLNMSVVKRFKRLAKDNRLILWTCRTGDELEEAIRLCNEQGLFFSGHNELDGKTYVKPRCDLLVDDKAVGVTFWFKFKCLVGAFLEDLNNVLNESSKVSTSFYY